MALAIMQQTHTHTPQVFRIKRGDTVVMRSSFIRKHSILIYTKLNTFSTQIEVCGGKCLFIYLERATLLA